MPKLIEPMLAPLSEASMARALTCLSGSRAFLWLMQLTSFRRQHQLTPAARKGPGRERVKPKTPWFTGGLLRIDAIGEYPRWGKRAPRVFPLRFFTKRIEH